MASSEDYANFKRVFRSKAQTSFGKILNTISAAAAASAAPESPPGGGEVAVAEEKRGLLEIDLNVAPPEDDGFDSPAAKIRPGAAKLSCGDGVELNFNGISEKGINGSKGKMDFVTDLEEEREKQGMRENRWDALLEVAENVRRRIKEEKFQNGKRKTSDELEIGKRRRISAAEEAAAPVVARSARGRALAMPNKYRDSVLDSAAAVAVAEAEFRRRDKSGKFAAVVVPTKRKSR